MNERRFTAFSFGNSLLASVMVVCFVTTVSRAIGVFERSWLTDLFSIQRELAIGAFFVALEVQWTRRLLEQHPPLSGAWWKFIVSEWGFWLIGLLAVMWITHGPALTLRDVPKLAELTTQVLMLPEFLQGLLLLFAVWGISRFLTIDLMALENIPSAATREAMRGLVEEHNTARNRLWQDVLVLGGGIVFLSVFSIPLARYILGQTIAFGSLGVETLLFFLCGLGLFVIGRLMILRAEWVTERTGIDPNVTRNWIGYGLLFVLLLLILAVVLPTEYSFQLLASLNLAILGITTLVSILWMVIIYPIIWLLSLVMPAMGNVSSEMEEQPPEGGLSQRLPSLPQGVTWEVVVREILFWGIAIMILIYIIRQLFPLRFFAIRRLRRWSWFRRLLDLLHRLRKGWTLWKRNLAQSVRESWQALREDLAGRAGWERAGFINLRGLDPRQSIRFYFFALLRRGAERGVIRRPAQTPREYSAVLSEEESLISDELQEMTLAFEEARYTKHAVSLEKARRVRQVWDTIRAYLRSSKQPGGTGGKR